jgi:hypothetical protein
VETLLTSLKPIGNVVLIAATFFTIFGILGVQVRFESFFHLVCLPHLLTNILFFHLIIFIFQLFKGKFFSCHLDASPPIEVKNKSECLLNKGKWVNNEYNFDNLARVSTLFISNASHSLQFGKTQILKKNLK